LVNSSKSRSVKLFLILSLFSLLFIEFYYWCHFISYFCFPNALFICSEDAVYYGGVRCNYWSLGESLKPGGCVNNFVVAAFCYHLFCSPKGHPNDSKRHYFFSNIAVSFTNILLIWLICYFCCNFYDF
jgi:hypothetical protein